MKDFSIVRTNSGRSVRIDFATSIGLDGSGITGSAKYPDPKNAKGVIVEAGYLCSIKRDSTVIARPGNPAVWVECEGDKLRGFVEEHKSDLPRLRRVFSAALVAAAAEKEVAQAELKAAQDAAAQGYVENDLQIEALVALWSRLSVEQKAKALGRLV